LAALSLLPAACSSELDPKDPEGAYLMFREALLNGDEEALWEALSESTKQLFSDGYQDLLDLDVAIDQLAPEDRTIARERTAARLLSRVDGPKSLFLMIVRLENVAGEDRFRYGSAVDEVNVDEEAGEATVVTEAGTQIELVRQEDGIWRVRSLAPIIGDRLRVLSEDIDAVEATLADSAFRRRSHDEIMRLLGAAPEPAEGPAPGEGTGEGVADDG
jgi:hypothetical protein